jgi:hypothetical protein
MDDESSPIGERLLLTAREAAELLHVSEKTLWNHTFPRGNKIPAVRFGKTLRYCPVALKEWKDAELKRQNGQQLETANG